MEGTGEEISRARLGVLSSLLAKAKGKVRVLKTWYKGDQEQYQDQDTPEGQSFLLQSSLPISTSIPTVGARSPSVFSSSQPTTLTTSPADRSASSLSTSRGPWVIVGRTASPSHSLTDTSQGSKFGQPSFWWGVIETHFNWFKEMLFYRHMKVTSVSKTVCGVGCSFSEKSLKKVLSGADNNAIACQEAITETLDPAYKRK